MDEKTAALRFDEAAMMLDSLSKKFNVPPDIKAKAQEIRLRIGKPISISLPESCVFLQSDGSVSPLYKGNMLTAWRENMDEAFRLICNCSVHSHQREIKNGFITIKGGHRAGICGTAVIENDLITNVRDISSINLRIARDVDGAAIETAKALIKNGRVSGSLIFGPPGCGKTTILRDLARRLSSADENGTFYRVAVIDERGEIAACFQGEPQNDLGPCCDVFDGYPKGEGIMQAVRSMSPDIVICDEVGSIEDAKAIEMSINAGVTIIASAHAASLEELKARPQIKRLIVSGAFTFAVRLKGRQNPGAVAEVYSLRNLTI